MRGVYFLLLAALAVAQGPSDTDSASDASPSAHQQSTSGGNVGSEDSGTGEASSGGNVGPAAADDQCHFCTIPDGYTSETWPAPLNVEDQFSRPWRRAHKKAKDFLADWSVEDKVGLATGVGWMQGRCVGNTFPLPQHNWTGLCLEDSPLGVRFADFVSAFPAAINVASTFDKDLMYHRGKAMGEEFKGKGVHVALGPMTNMGRVAAGGRNWEGFGGDPYLSGWATYQTIKGMQGAGVQATVKHFIGNEQERNRTTESSNIDDRTLREVYAHPFLRAVQADVAGVMASYNLINGSWAAQNSKLLNGILKTDWGFPGYVLSDWDGTHSGVASANSGLDMDMPGDIGYDGGKTSYFGANLTEAVNNGSVSTARLDDMAQRIMASWFFTKQEDYPPVNFDAWGNKNEHVDVQDDHYKVIRHIGAASTVLLKNVKGALPLNKPKSIVLVGSDMGPSEGGPNECDDRGCDPTGTLAMGWGSGTVNFPYLIDPLQAISSQAQKDRSTLNWHLKDWDLGGAARAARSADVAIVGIQSDSGEGYITVDGNEGDRNNLSAWNNGDELVLAVAAVNPNTVVVVHSVGPMDMEKWIDHENVTAVLWAGLPGQESGNALVEILYGKYNPSGRLPYTIAKQREDYPADIEYVNTNQPPETNVNYTEGLFIDYRHFLQEKITPRFPFGFGMSYTTFKYSNLQISQVPQHNRRNKHGERGHGHGGHGHGGHGKPDDGNCTKIGRLMTDELHRARWTVTVDIKNTGSVNGCDVPQLYLLFPDGTGEPPKVLRDFARINLDPGASQTVSFSLSQYDVSIWDVEKQDYRVPEGEFKVTVAENAMDDAGEWGVYTFGK